MELGLSNRVAVVTGGGSGIGKATAEMLVAEGCRVAVWDLNVSEPSTTSQVSVRCDVTNRTTLEDALRETEMRLGPVDIVVHAAAIGSGYFGFPFTRVPPDAWHRVFEVNVMGMVNIAHLFAPRMLERGQGCFAFLASVAGQVGSQTDPPYSASKAANINFAQCLAKDLAPNGIRVNTVCPGMVKTPLNESVWKAWVDQQPAGDQRTYEQWASDKIGNVIPLRRWQTVDDVAAMLVFLCSDRCREVTGQTINVDGGCVMHW